MSVAEINEVKKQLSGMTEAERQEISAYLIRLRHETHEWKEETARRLDRMKQGEQTSVVELRKRLGHT